MRFHSLTVFPVAILLAASSPSSAGTVVVTSLPDASHPISPLASGSGIPLPPGVTVAIGSFPGISDDQILDTAASGGLAAISSAFQPFGTPRAIGDGSESEAGLFEISASQPAPSANTTWVGQEISILISDDGSGEFLVARFKGENFAADPDTGIEPIQALHLANARIIVGTRNGPGKLATSTAPALGSFAAWIASYPALSTPGSNPEDSLPDADPDGDGRSNFLEYATGGDPTSSSDPSPFEIVDHSETGLTIRYTRARGTGTIAQTIQTSPDLVTPWQTISGSGQPDLTPVENGRGNAAYEWLSIQIDQPVGTHQFFRLRVEPKN